MPPQPRAQAQIETTHAPEKLNQAASSSKQRRGNSQVCTNAGADRRPPEPGPAAIARKQSRRPAEARPPNERRSSEDRPSPGTLGPLGSCRLIRRWSKKPLCLLLVGFGRLVWPTEDSRLLLHIKSYQSGRKLQPAFFSSLRDKPRIEATLGRLCREARRNRSPFGIRFCCGKPW